MRRWEGNKEELEMGMAVGNSWGSCVACTRQEKVSEKKEWVRSTHTNGT